MSQRSIETEASDADSNDDQPADNELLRDRVSTLEAENQRLREQYATTQQRTYRRTAIGLAGIGAVAAGAAVIVTSAQQILFALAGIGAFAAVLTLYLTPDQFIPVEIGEAVYDPLATNLEDITGELGLSGSRIYLETDSGSRLYIPEGDTTNVPTPLTNVFIVGDSPAETGIALQPTGARLADDFERTHTGPLPETPSELSAHLVEGIVEGFELATAIETDVKPDQHRAVFEITGVNFGSLSRFDHPVQSLLAVGIARGLETPVIVDRVTTDAETATVAIEWSEFVNSNAGSKSTTL